jgi:hypothetical protein
MRITHKGITVHVTKWRDSVYRTVAADMRGYFIRVENWDGSGWIGSIWKLVNTAGNVEIVRTVRGKGGRVKRLATPEAMIRAAIDDHLKSKTF